MLTTCGPHGLEPIPTLDALRAGQTADLGDKPPVYAIIEDEPLMAQLIRNGLKAVGMDAEVFMLGKRFLQCADQRRFKAILVDLSLPDIDGFELMDELAARPQSPPVVLISGHDPGVLLAASTYGKSMGLNIQATLTKPFANTELLAALALLP